MGGLSRFCVHMESYHVCGEVVAPQATVATEPGSSGLCVNVKY